MYAVQVRQGLPRHQKRCSWAYHCTRYHASEEMRLGVPVYKLSLGLPLYKVSEEMRLGLPHCTSYHVLWYKLLRHQVRQFGVYAAQMRLGLP